MLDVAGGGVGGLARGGGGRYNDRGRHFHGSILASLFSIEFVQPIING